MRTLNVSLVTEKNALDSASAWLPLVSVWINASTILRLVPNPTAITFNGITYTPFGMKLDDVSHDSKGGLNDLIVSVSNADRSMSAFIEANDLRGAKVSVMYVNSLYLADPTAITLEEHYEITAISVKGSQVVSFTLGHERILSHVFPASRFLRDNCRSLYRTTECGYVDNFAGVGTVSSSGGTITGVGTKFLLKFVVGDTITAASQSRVVSAVASDLSMTVTVAPSPVWSAASYTISKVNCSKLLGGNNGCRAHNNSSRFGGFPLIPFVGGRLA